MSRVYLLRHAQAQSGLRDHARPLTEYGKLQAQMMGQWLKLNLHKIDLAIVSSAKRTQQTFDALELEIESIVLDDAYNGGSEKLAELIRVHGEKRESILVIGHNPGVSDLANRAGYPQSLSPCACVIVDSDEIMSEFVPEKARIEIWHQARP